MARPRAIISWSSGKDSAYAAHVAMQSGDVEIVGALTTVTAEFQRVSMHGVREALLDRQMDELGLPCYKVRLPSPCPNEVYEQAMATTLRALRELGVTAVVFGDLFLADIRAYREAHLASVGMEGIFPLWHRDTRQLAEEMLDAGIAATLTCVDPQHLDASFAGRAFDRRLLDDLPPDVDPCGENGEFHTVVTAGPMFRKAIRTRLGTVVERDHFVFADVVPT